MNVLEKILEEIDKKADYYETDEQGREHVRMVDMVDVEEIIISHMDDCKTFEFDFTGVKSFDCQCGRHYVNTCNDGWIPVEERLPNKREFQEAYCRNHYAAEFLVTIEGATRPTTLYFKNNSWFDEERNYYKVIAWKPLPEPYRPKEKDDE